MKYNWQLREWPRFRYDASEVEEASNLFSVQLERAKAVLSAFDVSTEEGKKLEAIVAEALGCDLFSQADSWAELRGNIKEATMGYFHDTPINATIRLHFSRNEENLQGEHK